MKKYINTCSFIPSFPLWFLLLIPYSWPILLSISFGIDSILLLIVFFIVGIEDKILSYKRLILRVFIVGTLADIIGYLFLFVIMPLSSNILVSRPQHFIHQIASGVMDNPYNNLYSTSWVILSYLIGVVSAYLLHSIFSFRKYRIEDKKKNVIIFVLSVLSGPVLGFFG